MPRRTLAPSRKVLTRPQRKRAGRIKESEFAKATKPKPERRRKPNSSTARDNKEKA